VMMDADLAARRGLPILGLFRGMQLGAVAPEEMSIAITPAIRKLMAHHGLAMGDVDLWELHEAYAVTTLYNQAQLETPWELTNVNGGAVALGHPYGMSGIRYVGSTVLELGRRQKRCAVIGVCTAGGMATAAYLERP
jgi:acetyl-CoA C-acetyltransferase